MEDPGIILDRPAHNKGQSPRYDVSWDTCRTYIENTAGAAVDDQEHVTHLAASISVSDVGM